MLHQIVYRDSNIEKNLEWAEKPSPQDGSSRNSTPIPKAARSRDSFLCRVTKHPFALFTGHKRFACSRQNSMCLSPYTMNSLFPVGGVWEEKWDFFLYLKPWGYFNEIRCNMMCLCWSKLLSYIWNAGHLWFWTNMGFLSQNTGG